MRALARRGRKHHGPPLRRAGAAALALLLAAAPAASATWHRLTSVPGYPGMREELQSVVDQGGTTRVNHLCVVVADYADTPAAKRPARQLAYVYWPEGHSVLAYVPTTLDRIDGSSMSGAASFDLRHEVFPDWKAVKGVRGVSRSFASTIIGACRRHGDQFVIERKHG